MPHQKELKAIRLLQDRSEKIDACHHDMAADLVTLRTELTMLAGSSVNGTPDVLQMKESILAQWSTKNPLPQEEATNIYSMAEQLYPAAVSLTDVLNKTELAEAQTRYDAHIASFNQRYGLDGWDYAIAGCCGLFAAMLDILCVRAPLKPTAAFTQQADGIFNRAVQEAFNKLIPPDLSKKLSDAYTIGVPDSSVISDLLGAPAKTITPVNHRLRALSHDPVLGLIFGVLDMLRNTCTVVHNGCITSYPSTKPPVGGTVFHMIGRMFGHLLSDVNAPSANGNRGMGLPAPFMGLLRMFENIPVGDSNFGKQIEWMYVKGYDFRQFVATSIPVAIMEVLLRAFYVGKQVKRYDAPFGQTLLDTVPTRMNPRFRILLALAFGTFCGVNAGRMYITQNLLNLNYASWMGLVWNGFHALKWALLQKHFKLWGEIEAKEIEQLQSYVTQLEVLEIKAAQLPV